ECCGGKGVVCGEGQVWEGGRRVEVWRSSRKEHGDGKGGVGPLWSRSWPLNDPACGPTRRRRAEQVSRRQEQVRREKGGCSAQVRAEGRDARQADRSERGRLRRQGRSKVRRRGPAREGVLREAREQGPERLRRVR